MFKKWNFRKKNIAESEWKYIAYHLKQREAQRKSNSAVKVRGVLVLDSKIRKQRKLYEMTAFDQFQSGKFKHSSPTGTIDNHLYSITDVAASYNASRY